MKMLKKFHSLFCWLFFVWSVQRLEKTRGFSPFTLAGKYLPLASFKNLVVKDWLHCVIVCQQQEDCISYNYDFEQKKCELLNEGIVRQDGCSKQLLESRETIFHQMKLGCSSALCIHGRCFQKQLGRNEPYCVCNKGYEGHRCQVKQDTHFLFTNLGSTGVDGPQNRVGYQGTSLKYIRVNKGIQDWTVPRSGMYYVEVAGASGGDGINVGGKGAVVNGTVYMQKGVALRILVGQMGCNTSGNGGGGGGTFVVFQKNSSAFIVAGGGGGGGALFEGDPGQKGGNGSINGGTAMEGGRICGNHSRPLSAGAGGGFKTDGTCLSALPCVPKNCSSGGRSFLSGGRGGKKPHNGSDGGFGGGGSGEKTYAGGGGGGYSGGGVRYCLFPGSIAGGGGSFAFFSNFSVSNSIKKSHGHVLFQFIN